MHWISLIACFAAVQQPTDTARPFLEALKAGDEKTAQRRLASLDSVATLNEVYREGVKLVAELTKEEKRCASDLEANRVVYDAHGGYVRGNALEEWKAREALDKTRVRMALADDMVPRLCTALHTLSSDAAKSALLERARSGPDWFFRAHAVTALATHKDLSDLLSKETDAGVRVALIDALAPALPANRDLQELVVEQLKDPYWQVQVTALKALRPASPKWAIPKLITAMKAAGERLRWELNETLRAITGIDKNQFDAWDAWWRDHGEEFLAGTYVPPPGERADPSRKTVFYGLEIHSSNLVFVVDISSSMLQEARWKPDTSEANISRLEVARYELKRAIDALPSGVRLNVCLFWNSHRFFDPKGVVLDNRTRKRLAEWVDEIKADTGTNAWDALRATFDLAHGSWHDKLKSDPFDTIILLTDGEPTGRVTTKKLFLEKLAALNRYKKVAIHTIGIETTTTGEDFLKSIAAQNDGTYQRR